MHLLSDTSSELTFLKCLKKTFLEISVLVHLLSDATPEQTFLECLPGGCTLGTVDVEHHTVDVEHHTVDVEHHRTDITMSIKRHI